MAGPLFSTGNAPLRLHSWHRQDAGRMKGQLVLGCLAWASEEHRVQRMQPERGAPCPDGALSRPRGCRGATGAEVQDGGGGGERQHNHCTALEPSVCVMLLSRTQLPLRGSRGQKYSALAFQNIPLLSPLSSFFVLPPPCAPLTSDACILGSEDQKKIRREPLTLGRRAFNFNMCYYRVRRHTSHMWDGLSQLTHDWASLRAACP